MAIENLSSTRDLHDTIDLSDNEIRELDNVPPLFRLKHLYLSNNKISKIDPALAQRVPFLHTLILSGNNISELTDLVPLAGWSDLRHKNTYYKPQLEGLSLIDNPVCKKPNYRHFLISLIPSLRVLDYCKVTDKVRYANFFQGTQICARIVAIWRSFRFRFLHRSSCQKTRRIFAAEEGADEGIYLCVGFIF